MTTLAWWQKGVIYQVYPRSFQDENGDGVRDLAGITARLEYLATLGIDAIWLSPFYPSPMADFGYDIADYCAVDPVFGTLSDFDRLVEPAHVLGLKILVDFVPNHSSDQHPWFLESRASRASAKRDWYLWRDPASDGGPPNNCLSRMVGRPGSGIIRVASTITIHSCRNNLTSTGETLKYVKRWTSCCDSGSIEAWMAFG